MCAGSIAAPDVIAVAAPVRSPLRDSAAISVIGPAYRLDDERIQGLGLLVSAEADMISKRLGTA
ncbi:IclR family transcriptional regulator domain-containing protein [Nocardiopsis ansamitocini]|uniref:IclR-ED domain-containing protein n=1 Tax=Nocardiopsis ansamitocini TaxID=1670832 RepID=A0A9W6P7B9_9ACTN|nr:IclR family transcriptional regulator C-terminal domain-containing protein [Nocardiopsis ansamitocini]GLU48835.1 hypothetical protein Nans01_31860 [Nocardiopsis ansamitocini]